MKKEPINIRVMSRPESASGSREEVRNQEKRLKIIIEPYFRYAKFMISAAEYPLPSVFTHKLPGIETMRNAGTLFDYIDDLASLVGLALKVFGARAVLRVEPPGSSGAPRTPEEIEGNVFAEYLYRQIDREIEKLGRPL